jgi:uncharacterized membrane protein HdeD (DUF308 family)
MSRTQTHLIIGSLLIILGGYLLIFSSFNPVEGGCINFTNGTVICARTYDSPNILFGILLVSFGTLEILYAIRKRNDSDQTKLANQSETGQSI